MLLATRGVQQNGPPRSSDDSPRVPTIARLSWDRQVHAPPGLRLRRPGLTVDFALTDALTALLYSGKLADQLTGLQYLRARYYNPATGTFNRLDPFAGNFSDPQSLHKYLYCHADAVNGIDPSGLMSGSLAGMVATIAVGTIALSGLTIAWETGLVKAPKDRPGFLESLVPLWGSGQAYLYDLEHGHYGGAAMNAFFFVTDFFLLKSIASSLWKFGWKMTFRPGSMKIMFGEWLDGTFHAAWQVGDNFYHALGNTGGRKWFVRVFTRKNLLEVLEQGDSIFLEFTERIGFRMPALSPGMASLTGQTAPDCVSAMLAALHRANYGPLERVFKAAMIQFEDVVLPEEEE